MNPEVRFRPFNRGIRLDPIATNRVDLTGRLVHAVKVIYFQLCRRIADHAPTQVRLAPLADRFLR
jgi:hypothetical protein